MFHRIMQCYLFALMIYSSALCAEDNSLLAYNSSSAGATVVVADRSQGARERGMHAAFSQVMIQLSDDPAVMMTPEVKNATAHLTQWVDSYSYDESQDNGTEPKLLLQVNFDRAALEQLIKHANAAAQNTAPQLSLRISVANVQSASDYAKVIQTFQDSAAVDAVSVKDVDATHLLLLVKITGNTEQFKQTLSEKHALQPTMAEFQHNGAIADLYFDWIANQV